MKTKDTTMRQVALMQYAMDESERMSKLNALWVQTMDLKHQNMLAYPLDIQVEDVNDYWQRKYVDQSDFYQYKDENGSTWLISKSLSMYDMDEFFRNYLHLDEEVAA